MKANVIVISGCGNILCQYNQKPVWRHGSRLAAVRKRSFNEKLNGWRRYRHAMKINGPRQLINGRKLNVFG